MNIVSYQTLRKIMLMVAIGLWISQCSEEEDKKKAKIGAKFRSNGSASSLGLSPFALLVDQQMNDHEQKQLLLNTMAEASRNNTPTTVDYYKVPISRINLVTGLKGTGYSQASPNIYSCKGTTDAECLVDISKKSNVDNLLKVAGKATFETSEAEGADQAEVDAQSETTYDGVAVEYCHEFSSEKLGSGNGYFSVLFKGSVTLNGTTYYTNKSSGLSTTSPAEEVSIRLKGNGCGSTTPLLEAVTVKADSELNIVLYTEPTGGVYATNKMPSNIGCGGSSDLAICSDSLAIFGTVDDKTPTIERYLLTMTDTSYSNVLATVMVNSDNKVFGTILRNVFNDSSKINSLHATINIVQIVNNADGTITFKGFGGTDNELTEIIKNFKRDTHSSTILKYVDKEMAYTAAKLP